MKIKQAVILSGGLGSRLRPITLRTPKPMVRIIGRPFLYHLIMQCKKNGINNFLILCGYKHEQIKNYFKNGENLGVKIDYNLNHQNTKTLNRIINAEKKLDSNFLLLYSDNYSSLNLHKICEIYKKEKPSILLTLCNKKPGNISLKNNLLKKYYFKKNKKNSHVEIGYALVKKKILKNYDIYKKNLSFNNLINNEIKKKSIFLY